MRKMAWLIIGIVLLWLGGLFLGVGAMCNSLEGVILSFGIVAAGIWFVSSSVGEE